MGLEAAFDRAQARYDAQEPPDDHDCREDGHRWRRTRVAVIKDETIIEYKCRECGKTKAE
jgi:hypothetical protein